MGADSPQHFHLTGKAAKLTEKKEVENIVLPLGKVVESQPATQHIDSALLQMQKFHVFY
jgi:hypothetical protein